MLRYEPKVTARRTVLSNNVTIQAGIPGIAEAIVRAQALAPGAANGGLVARNAVTDRYVTIGGNVTSVACALIGAHTITMSVTNGRVVRQYVETFDDMAL